MWSVQKHLIFDLIYVALYLNSGIRQSCSSMPEYTKLQHTIQIQATKLITYSIQYKFITYNITHTTYNDNDNLTMTMTTSQAQHTTTNIQLQHTMTTYNYNVHLKYL